MLCQKCNKNQASVKYTEIINGQKIEMMLCDICSHELGLDNINFNMPIDFSSFFGGLLEDEYNSDNFMPLFQNIKQIRCKNCDMTYDEFVNKGKFGCPDCYNVFNNKIDLLLKKIQGSNEYLGRKGLNNSLGKKEEDNEGEETVGGLQNEKRNENNINKLQQELKKAIADERYEDAAKIRDEIIKMRDIP